MFQKTCLTVLTAVLMLTLVGCAENKLTRQNYDLVKEGMSTKLEVEATLGEKYADRGESWEYENEDEFLTVYIYWDKSDKVAKKEWISGKDETWEGTAPGIDEEPEGEKRYDGSSTTTLKKG
ncbi:MAG: hypothetical protein ABII12_11610 [Planctomycetota bacterium]